MLPLELRPMLATPKDYNFVEQVFARYSSDGQYEPAFEYRPSPLRWDVLCANAASVHTKHYIAVAEGLAVGFVTVQLLPFDCRPIAVIENLCVVPASRRKHYGSSILRAALKIGADCGANRVFGSVLETKNPASAAMCRCMGMMERYQKFRKLRGTLADVSRAVAPQVFFDVARRSLTSWGRGRQVVRYNCLHYLTIRSVVADLDSAVTLPQDVASDSAPLSEVFLPLPVEHRHLAALTSAGFCSLDRTIFDLTDCEIMRLPSGEPGVLAGKSISRF